MNSFWTLVGFEYRKIIKRKSFLFAVLIMVFMSTFCMVGDVFMGEDNYEKVQEWRVAAHQAAGVLDDSMFQSIIEKNARANASVTKDGNYPEDLYKECILPYSNFRRNLIAVFSPIQHDASVFNGLTSGENLDFYALRTEALQERMQVASYSQAETEAMLERNTKIETPFYYDFYDGYSTFMLMMSTSSIFIMMVLAMCIAPIFGDEYQKKTDAIVLSAKYGKSRLIRAKIFTILSFSMLFTVTALLIALVTIFAVYGNSGSNVSIQIWNIFSIYPLTMGKTILIYCLVIIGVAMLVGSICGILSAYFNSFATVTTTMLLLIGGLFVSIPTESLQFLHYFLPSKMMDNNYLFSDRLIQIGGLYLEPYIFVPIVCVISVVLLLFFSHRGFKQHQVS